MALHDWAREARSSEGLFTGEDKCVAAAGIRAETRLFIGARQHTAGESPRGADAWGRWYSGHAGAVFFTSAVADVDCRSGSIDRLREYCKSAAGAGNGKANGIVRAHGIGRYAGKDCPAATDRKRFVGFVGWCCWADCCLCWSDDAAEPRISGGAACSDACKSVDDCTWIFLSFVVAYGCSLRSGACLDRGTLTASRRL